MVGSSPISEHIGIADTSESVGPISVHDGFTDCNEVVTLIEGLPKISDDQRALENAVDRFTVILDKYQEQPHLLDPHLGRLLLLLVDGAVSAVDITTPVAESTDSISRINHVLLNQRFKLLYIVTKTRGYKVVIRHLPHEVCDLEPVLALLTQQDFNDIATWETRYMLLMWLSIIVMIPFHMSRLDANIEEPGGKRPIMERILDIGKLYLASKDCSMDAAAVLLSRFVVRPDVKDHHLNDFVNWALDRMSAYDGSVLARMGELAALTKLFKHGKREYMLPYASRILTRVLEKDFHSAGVAPKKLCIKLMQRIGMTFLKPRVAAWRYQRGSRSLEANLKVDSSEKIQASPAYPFASKDSEMEMSDDEDFDVPEEMERVIQEMLNGLKDKDTCIRWSAAKGIGRVTGRLPRELADEVVGSVVELFTPQETDSAWHGGCLALAELGRRGLLLPKRLEDVIPILTKALVYDEQKGSYSVGDHIRDAACYVCWAFARAYKPEVLLPYVNDIARALLITAVFDREIHCRRAASAAFQENVGRQGTFPHGIDIVASADYIAVGNMKNAFLSISVYIAQFPEYTRSLIDHLVLVKIMHWNLFVRELASAALCSLTPCDPNYLAQDVLPNLMQTTTCVDLNTRHGSIIAVAEIFHALIKCHTGQKAIEEVVGAAIVDDVRNLVSTLQQRKYYSGLGGELIRTAVCRLIERCSLAPLPMSNIEIIESWQNMLDDCLQHSSPKVQSAAVSALTPFCVTYYGDECMDKTQSLVAKYVDGLITSVEHVRLGLCMALGSLPKAILVENLNVVIPTLTRYAKICDKEEIWAKARQEAINALTSICSSVGVRAVPRHLLLSIFECFFEGLRDYTIVDSTGDVGSYVRMAAMIGIETLVLMVVKEDQTVITVDIAKRFMCGIAQQACEKINNTRATAARIFYTLLHNDPVVPHVPHREELLTILPVSVGINIQWTSSHSTFPIFGQLLALQAYTYPLLLGLAASAGGMTESLVRDSLNSLLLYVRLPEARTAAERRRFCETLVRVFRDHQLISRVTIPLIKMMDRLLSSGGLDDVLDDPCSAFSANVADLVKNELAGSGDPIKILSGANLLCDLLQNSKDGGCRSKSLSHLLVLLCHRYPRVRMDVASKLFIAFVTYEDAVPVESVEEVTNLLSETDWGKPPVTELRLIRNRLCQLLNVPEPKLVKK